MATGRADRRTQSHVVGTSANGVEAQEQEPDGIDVGSGGDLGVSVCSLMRCALLSVVLRRTPSALANLPCPPNPTLSCPRTPPRRHIAALPATCANMERCSLTPPSTHLSRLRLPLAHVFSLYAAPATKVHRHSRRRLWPARGWTWCPGSRTWRSQTRRNASGTCNDFDIISPRRFHPAAPTLLALARVPRIAVHSTLRCPCPSARLKHLR